MAMSEWLLFRVAGSVACAVVWFIPTLPNWLQVAALAVLVVLTGLPHGGLDPFVAKQRGLWSSLRGLSLFGTVYVAIAAAVVGVWLLAPTISLSLFLMASAWHFGGDWCEEPGCRRWAIGSLIIGLPALFHAHEVEHIYGVIAGVHASQIVLPQALIAVVAAGTLIVTSVRSTAALDASRTRWLDLIILVGLAAALPPIIYFMVYFCALHSPLHLSKTLQNYDRIERRHAISFSAMFTSLTLLVALGVYLLLPQNITLQDATLQMVFIGLGALTVPHLLLIDGCELDQTRTLLRRIRFFVRQPAEPSRRSRFFAR